MRKVFTLISWLMALVGVVLAVVHTVVGQDANDSLYLIATVQLAIAIAVAVFVHQPERGVWLFVVAITAVSVCGQVIDDRYSAQDSMRALSESCFLLVQLLLIAALVLVVRRRSGTDSRGVLADGIIIGLGAWLLVWVGLLQPSLGTSMETSLVTALRGGTLGASTIVLFLLATLLFSDAEGTASVYMIGASIALSLSGDLLYAIDSRGDVSIDVAISNAPYIACLFFASAAFLHPSIRNLTRPGVPRSTPPLTTRLITTTTALVVPVLVVAITDPRDATDRIVRALSIAVLAIAVTTRVIQSVRGNARAQAELVRAAQSDSLTGLPNRTFMDKLIATALHQSWQTNRQPTVLFIDVDRFKNINDSLGHMAGDDVLTAVASRLVNAVPDGARVGRMSGDEFVVVDPNTQTPADAAHLAEHVLDSFREPLSLRQGDMFVSASIGVATAPPDKRITSEELLRNADTAMYRAKESGRNCIAIFDESMLERVSQRLTVETALYRALERRELRLVHQPIVDVDLGIVIGFEALMRWQRDDGETISPAEFIPIAEETGTIVSIGAWALLDALSQLRHWIDGGVVGRHTTMSVNVSPRQLHDPHFVSVVNEALVRSGISPDQLWLEVTESVMMTEPEQALAALRRLVAIGVRIAIDDFGTGFSSLSLLQQFPIQRIKIDRAFVQDIADDTSSRSLVKTIIAMAEALNLDIVAEGVENIRQLDALSGLHCHKAQGYLISHPVSGESIPSTVATLENAAAWSRLRREGRGD